ncbi:hypothetical protein [Rhizobium sp. AP16]|uniref:hypothetical protein n=1 Tax=Rhizobium sp. AP16 TaxID=1144306 RepID=UPI00026EDA3F|nr:hypothetical protein [Rhizobium sp. AP16]EJK82081.1 hypothetical protein PMI03_03971 [Rhizobium sp. AP16]
MLSVGTIPRTRLILAANGYVPQATNCEALLEQVRSEIIAYVRKKNDGLPINLANLEDFEEIDGSVTTASVVFREGRLWVLRFSEPDESTPGRSWVVELSVGLFGTQVLFGCRLYCSSRNYDFAFEHAAPSVLRKIVEKVGLSDYGVRLSSSATKVDTDGTADDLYKIIANTQRWRDVLVVSCDDGFSSLIDPASLARSLSGVAHVYFITPYGSHRLSELVGRELSVFDRGVRLYRPNFSEEDDKSQHPLILRRQLENISDLSRRKFEASIKEDCFRVSIERKQLNQKVPSFVDIRVAASKQLLEKLNTDDSSSKPETLLAEQSARKAAEQQADASFALAVQEEELRKEADAQREIYKGQLFAARSRLDVLEQKLANIGVYSEVGERPISYSEIPQWVERNFPGKLILHARVHRGLKSAVYQEIATVCDTLKLLANEYRQVFLGEMRKEEFTLLLNERHLDISGSISESRASEYGDEYFVEWNGRREFLHGHVSKGNSRDEKYCMRIYFFWNALDSQIVVGWLPSHLKNRLS